MFLLKVDKSYQIEGGYLIPRSHMSSNNGIKYAVVEILEIRPDGHYIKKHTTLTQKEFKKMLGLAKNERLDII